MTKTKEVKVKETKVKKASTKKASTKKTSTKKVSLKMTKDQKKTSNIVTNILNALELEEDQYKLEFKDENQIILSIQVPEDQTGLFIGRHGETINSIRLLLSLIIGQRLSSWPHLRLNVNDYQEKRSEALLQLANDAIQRAIQLQREIILPNLSSYERRIVHLHIESTPEVVTESRGESPNRQLIIIPQAK